MARQKGLFKVTGTLGDVNFYAVKGVGYARKAGGGFNGKAIKTKASMQRVRENASEFGHCSSVKKVFRIALLPLFNPPKSSDLHRRMMGVFSQIKDLDLISERGQRKVSQGISTAKGKQLLRNFVFVPECTAPSFVLAHSHFDWDSQSLTINPMDLKSLKFPKGATHLRLTLGVLDFDFVDLTHRLHCSPNEFLEKGSATGLLTLQSEVIEAPMATGLVLLGVQFVEVIEGEVYSLKSMASHGCQLISLF